MTPRRLVTLVALSIALAVSGPAAARKKTGRKKAPASRPAAGRPGGGARPAPRPATPTATPAFAESAAAKRARALERRVKELEARLKRVEQNSDDNAVKQMIIESKIEALTPEKKEFELKTFTGHARSMQGLNPELSITGDMAGVFVWSDGKEYTSSERSGFRFRGLGLHFQSNLDPFSFMKAAVSVSPEGVHFGEAYIVWTGVGEVMNITMGKFRQQLGVVNRWHKHGLDQYDFPLMLTVPFGEGGLNQVGIALEFVFKNFIAHTNEVEIQITNGMNEAAFEGGWFSLPTSLVHFKNYWDLTRSTYLELGFTGIVGFNHHRGKPSAAPVYTDETHTQLFGLWDEQGNPVSLPFAPSGPLTDEGVRLTAFGGVDLTIQWEPIKRSKYYNVVWRTEFLYGYKELAPDSQGAKQTIHWMGGYSYLEGKVSRQISVGLRGDLVQLFAVDNAKNYIYQVVPYLVWRQSPWVLIRLEYNYENGNTMPGIHRAIAQVVFAAGPHKHERY